MAKGYWIPLRKPHSIADIVIIEGYDGPQP